MIEWSILVMSFCGMLKNLQSFRDARQQYIKETYIIENDPTQLTQGYKRPKMYIYICYHISNTFQNIIWLFYNFKSNILKKLFPNNQLK